MERKVWIVPNEEEYNFRFDDDNDSCFRVINGYCPVEKYKNEILSGELMEGECKCVKLIASIIKDGFHERNRATWIEIIKNGKKYEISNGRHRICAASKLGVEIMVHDYQEE